MRRTFQQSAGFCVAFFLTVSVRAQETPRLVSLFPAAARPGEETVVPLSLSDVRDFAGGDFAIAYDPAILSVVRVKRTAITQNMLLYWGTVSPGRLTFSMAGAEGLTGNGPETIAEISVRCSADAPVGATSALVLRTARWYDEQSVRHSFWGRCALFCAGTQIPAAWELMLTLEEGAPPSPVATVDVTLVLTPPEAAATVQTRIEFDSALFSGPVVQPGVSNPTWQITTTPSVQSGSVLVLLRGAAELRGLGPAEVARLTFAVLPQAPVAASTTINLIDPRVVNGEGFAYAVTGVGRVVSVPERDSGTPTPSPLPTPDPDFNADRSIDRLDLEEFIQTWHQERGAP